MTDWQLRYRSPLSPTKGVDDVTIQTEGRDPARARVVADYWLGKSMGHPSTRFVFIRPVVVQTEADMIAELAAIDGAKVKADTKPVEPKPEKPARIGA